MTALSQAARAGVIFPTGMIGAGFPIELMHKGIEMGATAIAIDAGSTDSGPSYLGTGTAKASAAAVERDLRTAIVAGREAGIPVVVGSCGTAGTDGGVDWMADMAERIAKEDRLSFKMARIYSEQDPEFLVEALQRGRIHPLAPAGEADASTLRSCEHIVALMGHEPMAAALAAGADVVLAGRATDTSMVAAVALPVGLPAGPVWHAAKTVECGGLCTTNPRAAGGSSPVYVDIDMGGFTVTPLHEAAACTPRTVAAHMLYENADPIRLHEPTGILDTSKATYAALDSRVVRVEGSLFETSPRPTAKLEGSRKAGYETLALVGIADPHILSDIEVWMDRVMNLLTQRVRSVLRLEPGQYQAELRCYGYNAVLGELAPSLHTPAEVGVLLKVRADDQATATSIAKTANPLLLHQPLPTMDYLPSLAFVTSPAEIERGVAYEFALNHIIDMADGNELFRTKITEVTGA